MTEACRLALRRTRWPLGALWVSGALLGGCAREALPPLEIPAAYTPIDGYDFLWGSPDPLPWSVEEARRLLQEPEA